VPNRLSRPSFDVSYSLYVSKARSPNPLTAVREPLNRLKNHP
jgi:hypothetical protein